MVDPAAVSISLSASTKGSSRRLASRRTHGGLASAHEPDQHDAARPEALADPRHARLPVVLLVFGKG